MFPIDSPGATPDKKFTEGDPVAGVPATVVSAKFMNDVQAELLNILAGTTPPTTPNSALQNQVITAIKALITAAIPSAPADASETVKGIVQLANAAQILAGTDAAKAVSPLGLLASFLGAGGTAANDYVTIPYRDKTTGVRRQIIIQWGSGTAPGVVGSVTFPLAYPNAVRAVVGISYNNNGGATDSIELVARTNSGFTAYCPYSPGAFDWIAIGY